MENSTSHQDISTATPMLQEWCDTQSYQGQLPAFITCSSGFNAVVNSLLSLVTESKWKHSDIAVSQKDVSSARSIESSVLQSGRLGSWCWLVRPASVCQQARNWRRKTRDMQAFRNHHTCCWCHLGRHFPADSFSNQCRPSPRDKEVATFFRARLVLVACWFFSTFHALMLFVSPEFFTLFQILGIIMCIGVSTVSYIIIFHTLRRLQRQVQNYGPGEEASQNTFNIKRYKKTVSTALWVYASLLACYLPFMFSVAVQMSVSRNSTFIAVQWYTVTLIYMNSALNPILYCWKIPEVRESVKEIVKEYCCCRK